MLGSFEIKRRYAEAVVETAAKKARADLRTLTLGEILQIQPADVQLDVGVAKLKMEGLKK
jgi:hypothetical protein